MFTEGHVPGLEGGVTLSYGSKSVMTERVNILYDTIKEHSRMDQGLLSSPGIQPMPRPQESQVTVLALWKRDKLTTPSVLTAPSENAARSRRTPNPHSGSAF